ncbi:hypothetical protein PI125_g9199 [Phytophthora idaei]|nr:hypothetical protein PI125_g9199 [Phytophthora idaei]KAG3159044.1 hypothetical protein PI126_g7579 [Phytophthora idaei]
MGGKKRYVMNPFPSMELSAGDKVQLQKTANGFLVECLHSYEMFLKEGGHNVDERRWKPLKTRENLRLFLEREVRTTTDGNHSMMNEASEQAGTPVSLCIGKMQGTLDDVVFGTNLKNNDNLDDDRHWSGVTNVLRSPVRLPTPTQHSATAISPNYKKNQATRHLVPSF